MGASDRGTTPIVYMPALTERENRTVNLEMPVKGT